MERDGSRNFTSEKLFPRNRIRRLELYPNRCRCRQAAAEKKFYRRRAPPRSVPTTEIHYRRHRNTEKRRRWWKSRAITAAKDGLVSDTTLSSPTSDQRELDYRNGRTEKNSMNSIRSEFVLILCIVLQVSSRRIDDNIWLQPSLTYR
jgi:hypothetical protein